MARTKQDYADNGVEISKSTIGVGDEVTLYYKGLLVQSGAETVFAHIGYGENWDDKAFIPMERDDDVFKATIKIDHSDDLNIAFKDSGDNWDNNSWANYSFKVSKKAAKAAKIVSKEEKTEKKASTKSTKSSETKSAASKKSTATKSASAKKTAASGRTKKTSSEK
ncbi:carbohydrate-binding protein [Acetivibrio mesophilus]|uniref:Carbohydrate-binding protein n=1 Tax=Acetivibrio mesophilus TaxID=2487273 RepID=A0A4Q0I2H6_9FIRM|nr:carbohydrate-binding protein [Acetivibrio mesophilus]ODM27961.1 carbohydrate-binding protein [Clostridium sp. Bc-iso-3]RXE58396.1 carbohydrate-binding protein [Acetivibrio mesophilus]HHV28839.1 carbohydrate-binding protein [Clostridium sp.]